MKAFFRRYVVLSRVRTMSGLYLGEKLSEDLEKYKQNPHKELMLAEFEQTIPLKSLADEEYEDMFSY